MKGTRILLALLLFAPRAWGAYASRDLVIPVVGRATGADARIFDTSIWITNVSPAAADVTMSFFKSAFSNRNPHKTAIHLDGGETRVIDSMDTDGTGAMRVESTEDVVATARTFSRMPNETESRTIGASFAAIPVQFAIGNGGSTELQGIVTQGARYKIYLVETAGRALTVKITVMDTHGAPLANKNLFIDAYQQTTIDTGDTFPKFAAERAVVRVDGINGEGRVIAAGSQIATDSRDGTPFEMSFATGSRHRLPTTEIAAYALVAVAVIVAALRKSSTASA
jgi:hypothetical protein